MKYYLLADLQSRSFHQLKSTHDRHGRGGKRLSCNLELNSNSKLQGCKLFVYGIDQNMDNGDLQVKFESYALMTSYHDL